MNLLKQSEDYYNELYNKMNALGAENISLAQHAEMWYYETSNKEIPERYTPEWYEMYKRWIDYAFKNL